MARNAARMTDIRAQPSLHGFAEALREAAHNEDCGCSLQAHDLDEVFQVALVRSADLAHDIITEVADTQRLEIRALTDLVHDLAQSLVRQWHHSAVLDPVGACGRWSQKEEEGEPRFFLRFILFFFSAPSTTCSHRGSSTAA